MRKRIFPLWLLLTFASCKEHPTTLGGIVVSPGPAPTAFSEPMWSPDGSTIGFNHTPLRAITRAASGRYHYDFDLDLGGFWLVESDGSNMRRVVPFYLGDPDWSPDGKWFAYERGGKIWKMPVVNNTPLPDQAELVTSVVRAFWPDWSPDGRQIAFAVSLGAEDGIFSFDLGSQLLMRIGEFVGANPEWSPDAMSIAYTGGARMGGERGVCVMLATGENATVVVPDAWEAQWSPAGALAFVKRVHSEDETYEIYLRESIGARRLTFEGTLGSYSWSPAGDQLVYTKYSALGHGDPVNGTLWIMDVASGSEHLLAGNTILSQMEN